ncbi:MAG: amidohydrolase family protein [Acidobacteria bacterium]|nr:amidohydrolase family protein [Acidobacteriota bacterium]
MPASVSRRRFLAASTALAAPAKPYVIETHVHLFAADQKRFPYHPQATYRPPAAPLEDYVKFAREAGLAHTVIVHPEPYQDDHRYLEHCFANEPSPGFFKGTCLFDPIAPETPARMEALVKKHPGRIVALRMHAVQDPKLAPTTSGAIRDRDLRSPALRPIVRKAHELGLAIQFHMIPFYAPQVAALAAEFPGTPMILDHLVRAAQGTPEQYEEVLRLARFPKVIMKFSSVAYSSRRKHPFDDVRPLARRVFDAFGPERIVWGSLGHTLEDFQRNDALLDRLLDFAPAAGRARIRGLNAARLFGFRV